MKNYFNTVFKFRDYDETIYYVKKVDGVFGMYDENDKLLTVSTPPGTVEKMYITKVGTWVDVDPETGDTKIRGIPDLYYMNDGETLDAADLIVIFPSVESNNIAAIEVSNTYGKYSIVAMKEASSSKRYFVLGESPFVTTNDDAISYITYYASHVTANERLDEASKDLSEYGLIAETRMDADGKLYEYEPSYYVVTTDNGEKHKIIIGDKLIDGSGYYVQYENNSGEVRPAVYIIKPADVSAVSEKMTYESTIMGPAKNYLTPALIFSQSNNTFFEVKDFSVSHKTADGKNYDELINFSYIDIDDREGTLEGSHPYAFNHTSFVSYRPNHDNIDNMIQKLIEPEIVDIAAVNPTNEDKVKYGIMSIKVDENGDPILDENGNKQYYYDSEYVLKFDKDITLPTVDSKGQSKDEVFKITQKVYISKMNENGNYYTYTLITMPEATDKGMVESININVINEVSESTFSFLKWDPYNWVYPSFMQINISYVNKIDFVFGDYFSSAFGKDFGKYSVSFDLNHQKVGTLDTLSVGAKDNNKNDINTFSALTFNDKEGYKWVISPQRIYVYDKDGNELKVPAIKFADNAIGERVHYLSDNSFRTDEHGNKIYVDPNTVTIVRNNGKTESIMRYQTTLFRKVFVNLLAMKLVDSYVVSEEEIAKIVTDDNFLGSIAISNNEGKTQLCEFYSITARKAYVVVDGQGGFYIHTANLQKLFNDVGRFFAGEDIDLEGIS